MRPTGQKVRERAGPVPPNYTSLSAQPVLQDYSQAVSAKVRTAESSGSTVIDVERVDPGEWQPVGVGQSRGDATVLELRFPATA